MAVVLERSKEIRWPKFGRKKEKNQKNEWKMDGEMELQIWYSSCFCTFAKEENARMAPSFFFNKIDFDDFPFLFLFF